MVAGIVRTNQNLGLSNEEFTKCVLNANQKIRKQIKMLETIETIPLLNENQRNDVIKDLENSDCFYDEERDFNKKVIEFLQNYKSYKGFFNKDERNQKLEELEKELLQLKKLIKEFRLLPFILVFENKKENEYFLVNKIKDYKKIRIEILTKFEKTGIPSIVVSKDKELYSKVQPYCQKISKEEYQILFNDWLEEKRDEEKQNKQFMQMAKDLGFLDFNFNEDATKK